MTVKLSYLFALAWLAAGPALAGSVAPSQDGETLIPVPRMKPANLVPHAKAAVSWPAEAGDWPGAAVAEARAACEPALEGKDIAWTPLAPLGKEGSCGAPAPVEVTAIAGVALVPSATLTCPMAAALHDWITRSVQPAAERDLKTRVVTIHTASSYVCRLRNNQASGKLSEHGRANALDMSGFAFARTKEVTVADGWGGLLQKIGLSRKGGFLEDIRKDACGHFTTVLGPGSDAYHGDHFHVDALQRKNGWRICN
jgi:hypothetical protein